MPEFSDFIGDWTLTRVIEDAKTGAVSHLTGQARFSPTQDGVLYLETGVLETPAGRFEATRRYRWAQEGARIVVRFEDGRSFHSFAPDGTAEATHWCDPDWYAVCYEFTDWPRWQSVWRVTGPRKEYEMVTVYAPIA